MKKLNQIYNNFKDIIMLIKKSCRNDIGISLLIIVLNSLIAPIVTWLYKLLIDNISSDKSFDSINGKIITIIILYLLLKIVLEGVEILNSHISIRINYNISNEISKNINNKLSKIELEELESPKVYDLLDRIEANVGQGIFDFMNSFILMLMPLFSLGSYIILLSSINLYFPMITIIATIPYLILVIKQGKDTYFQAVDQNKESRKLNYMYDILTSREYAKEIRIFNLIDYFNNKTESIRNKLWNEKFKLLVKYCTKGILMDLLRNLSLGLCLLITCMEVINNKISIGNVMLAISSIQAITNNLHTIISKLNSINKFSFYINDWKQFLNLPEEFLTKQKKVTDTTITFQDISFQYPNSKQKSLADINITIKPGEKIALVGKNGSGKTTFIKLLLGIYKPTKGEIYVGENTIKEVIDDLREKIICIFQDFIKYQMSVEDNIRAGNFGNRFREDLLDILYLNKFIDGLPNGVNTQLGQLDKNAYELSGGEWQKLAIARILSREISKILIMDEPTSSLDPKIENDIYENFSALCGDRTTILISHRLGVTKLCDKIYVFDDGKIIENGSHSELMKLKGNYYNMYLSQSSLYI